MQDRFFSKEACDRCGNPLHVRMMSWFTDETICMKCSEKESELKEKLRKTGKSPDTLEGCGYVPEI